MIREGLVLEAIVLCESAARSRSSGRFTVINTLRRIYMQTVPSALPDVDVFLSARGVREQTQVEIRLEYHQGALQPRLLGRALGTLIPSDVGAAEAIVPLGIVTLPQPGRYAAVASVDQVVIGSFAFFAYADGNTKTLTM